MIKISVIIPIYNAENYIEKAFSSLKRAIEMKQIF